MDTDLRCRRRPVIPVAVFFYLIRKHLLMGMTFGVLGKAGE
jgi:hypothetical protein